MKKSRQKQYSNLYSFLLFLVCLLSMAPLVSYAQFKPTHIEQQELARKGYFESQINPQINNKYPKQEKIQPTDKPCTLNKKVFGYHPSWVGEAYNYYDWNLLSDLCYFSLEVAPSSGMPLTTNEWETAAVIDSALAHGVRVHLCVTLFSGHTTFFNSATSQQTLISQIIEKMRLRNAVGVNLDVEALPAALTEKYNSFIVLLATQVHDSIAGSIVSIAAPAVDWSNELDIPLLVNYVDLFMVMTYDYYWNGSEQAGPVAPLFPMTVNFDYGVARTISWYISEGVPLSKILVGVPYYGRDWPVESPNTPSNTTGTASAITYRIIRNNSSTYNTSTLRWEKNSNSPYYSYFTDRWHQCFSETDYSLGEKYDMVNMYKLGGIGIWALGYDKGYNDLWNKISEKFTNCTAYNCTDTLYDNGGPANNYYNNEDYVLSISSDTNEKIRLDFIDFDIEEGYDYLWIYDGADTNALLVGKYTGKTIPESFSGTSNKLTLRFHADSQATARGWKAIRKCPTAGFDDPIKRFQQISISPNPALRNEIITLNIHERDVLQATIRNIEGKRFECISQISTNHCYAFCIENRIQPGIYILEIIFTDGSRRTEKLLLL